MSKYIISYEGRTISKIDAEKLVVNPDGQSILYGPTHEIVAIVAKTDTVFKLPYND